MSRWILLFGLVFLVGAGDTTLVGGGEGDGEEAGIEVGAEEGDGEAAEGREPSRGWPRPAAGASRSGGPEVLFTFDDGPHGRYTRMILDALAEHRVKAIFYWVGHRLNKKRAFRRKRVAMVRRAVKEGHLVATHTINHVHLCSIPPSEAAREIDGARALYERLTGLPMMLFRAPYGDRCRRLLEMMKERRLHHLHWDIDPREWEVHDSSVIAANVIRRLEHLDDRAVILMHDTKLVTARALPQILQWIEEENERRRSRGGKPIRILSGSELVAEDSELGLARWFLHSSSRAGAGLAEALGRLVPGHREPVVGRR